MPALTPENAERFILDNTALIAPPHVPEISLRLADEAHALWLRTEDQLAEIGLPPPFWAFAWAGGQGLSRYILDHPETVRGLDVLDFATGSGLVAIAAKLSGARRVLAADIDPFCRAAVQLNASANGVEVEYAAGDLVGRDMGWDVLLAGDVFYDRSIVERLVPWFDALDRRGCRIVVGDPGRAYLPRDRLSLLATYEVAVSRELEDSEVKKTTVWSWRDPGIAAARA